MKKIKLTITNKITRFFWNIFWLFFIKISPKTFHTYRRIMFIIWGAKIDKGAHIYPDVRVWLPSNLELGPGACLGPGVDVYNVAKVTLSSGALVSQKTYICTASHDYDEISFPLIADDVYIGKNSWVSAECFIGPGVKIGENSIAYARSVIIKDIDVNSIVAGNPAKPIKKRT